MLPSIVAILVMAMVTVVSIKADWVPVVDWSMMPWSFNELQQQPCVTCPPTLVGSCPCPLPEQCRLLPRTCFSCPQWTCLPLPAGLSPSRGRRLFNRPRFPPNWAFQDTGFDRTNGNSNRFGDFNRPGGDSDRPGGDFDRPAREFNRPGGGDFDRPRGNFNRPGGNLNRPGGGGGDFGGTDFGGGEFRGTSSRRGEGRTDFRGGDLRGTGARRGGNEGQATTGPRPGEAPPTGPFLANNNESTIVIPSESSPQPPGFGALNENNAANANGPSQFNPQVVDQVREDDVEMRRRAEEEFRRRQERLQRQRWEQQLRRRHPPPPPWRGGSDGTGIAGGVMGQMPGMTFGVPGGGTAARQEVVSKPSSPAPPLPTQQLPPPSPPQKTASDNSRPVSSFMPMHNASGQGANDQEHAEDGDGHAPVYYDDEP